MISKLCIFITFLALVSTARGDDSQTSLSDFTDDLKDIGLLPDDNDVRDVEIKECQLYDKVQKTVSKLTEFKLEDGTVLPHWTLISVGNGNIHRLR